jgi:hypothetical protein
MILSHDAFNQIGVIDFENTNGIVSLSQVGSNGA